MNIEEELLNKASIELMHDIDREVLWSMLENIGWYRVMIPYLTDNKHAIDIREWLALNCKEAFECSGRDFIFESQKDANWFKLRWGTV
jgi:hypothetical protein